MRPAGVGQDQRCRSRSTSARNSSRRSVAAWATVQVSSSDFEPTGSASVRTEPTRRMAKSGSYRWTASGASIGTANESRHAFCCGYSAGVPGSHLPGLGIGQSPSLLLWRFVALVRWNGQSCLAATARSLGASELSAARPRSSGKLVGGYGMDDDGIRALLSTLARPHPSGGKTIERAALLAAGPDSRQVIAWIVEHDGTPEGPAATAAGRGLHGSRMSSGGSGGNDPLRYVLAPGVIN